MAEVVLDARKWAKKISRSRVLSPLLEDVPFLKEKIDCVLTMYSGQVPGASYLIRGLMFTLEDDQRVMRSVEHITNDSAERKSLLLWFAFEVYSAAREQNVLHSRTAG